MSLLQILTDPQNFKFYAGGRGHVSNAGAFGQKSIPYGNDTKGGGSSGQPYIQSPIPDEFTNNPSDFLLRNGYLNPISSIEDVSRLTKMFFDLKSPNGLLFIAKQQLLSATAPRTQTSPRFGLNDGLYSPLNTLAEAGIVSIGGHLKKQGINPFAGTGAYSNNDRLYGVKVNKDQLAEDNRLWQLMNGRLIDNNAQGPDPAYVMRYRGGPGSVLGVGRTLIRFGKDAKTPLTLAPGSFNFTSGINLIGQNDWTFSANLIKSVDSNTAGVRPGEIVPPITNKNQIQSPKLQDFRKIIRSNLKGRDLENATNSGATTNAPDYQTKGYIQNYNFTDPGQRANKSYANYTRGVVDSANNSLIGPVDKINAAPIYQSERVSDSSEFNDFVSFRIAAINNNNPAQKDFIHFRALLDSFTDNYNAEWGSVRYLGRGENFYNYNGFTREVNLTFTAAAQSKQELIPMYTKLNYLASQLMPDYSGEGYMRGALVQLTVGGYLYEQPGFITSLAYDLINDAPWEIAIDTEGNPDSTVKQLSHMVKVTSFTFVPIHRFVPRKQQLGFGSDNYVSSYGDERFIALQSTPDDSNYIFQGQIPSTATVPARNFSANVPGPGNILRSLPPNNPNNNLGRNIAIGAGLGLGIAAAAALFRRRT
jgi:hypothetical protein